MNIPCEQLKSDLSLDIAIDEVITEILGKDNCDYIKFTNTHTKHKKRTAKTLKTKDFCRSSIIFAA